MARRAVHDPRLPRALRAFVRTSGRDVVLDVRPALELLTELGLATDAERRRLDRIWGGMDRGM